MSSSMVYGDFNADKVNEDKNCKPIGIYGTLKFSGELLVKSYNQVFDLPYTQLAIRFIWRKMCE